MRFVVFFAALWSAAFASCAYAQGLDSTKSEQLNEVVVQGVSVALNAPFSVSRIDGRSLERFSRSGQELPFLFARTPGVVAWSENGLGTGTTYMRIRGAADSRINVTLDGVTFNSPEDQCVFWANTNSYASFLGSVQIQRGVGSSTGGDGAFGGTVALHTKMPSLIPRGEVSVSYGAYNTYNIGGGFATGLLGKRVILDGVYHHTGTDGFVHGTAGNSGSYYVGLTYMNPARTLKISYKQIGNYEKTGQAWNGVTAGNNDGTLNDNSLVEYSVTSYKDMYRHGLGRYNSLYESLVSKYDANWNTVFPTVGGKYITQRYELSDGTLWKQTTDNFWQHHNLVNAVWTIDDHWSATATLHYTYGYGYYKEFRPQNKASKFGLAYADSKGKSIKTDFIRQKGLSQHTYGLVCNMAYRNVNWDCVGGLSLQHFSGGHFGYLTYVADAKIREEVLRGGKYRYYDSDAHKRDYIVFLKGTYHFSSQWDAFADLQYRHVGFSTGGVNDRFIAMGDGSYANQQLDICKRYDFLNPKFGVSFHYASHKAYLSYALGHREPERNNFTDNYNYPAPKAELVHDMEAGYRYNRSKGFVDLGVYAMLYQNQFVQTGEKSDIGENLTTNIKRSRRMGIELQGGFSPAKWLSLEANVALSMNQILDFNEMVETYDASWKKLPLTVVHYDKSTLAFSPSAILNGFVDFHYKGFRASWHTNFVSRQYLDNTKNHKRSLPSFSQTNLHLGYELFVNHRLQCAVFGLNLNNIFNARYASSGWVYSAIVGSNHPQENRYYQIGYVPMAGYTLTGSVVLKF